MDLAGKECKNCFGRHGESGWIRFCMLLELDGNCLRVVHALIWLSLHDNFNRVQEEFESVYDRVEVKVERDIVVS